MKNFVLSILTSAAFLMGGCATTRPSIEAPTADVMPPAATYAVIAYGEIPEPVKITQVPPPAPPPPPPAPPKPLHPLKVPVSIEMVAVDPIQPVIDITDQLMIATMTFEIPSEANVEDVFEAELSIEPLASMSALPTELTEDDSDRIITEILVSHTVSATLESDGFDIRRTTPVRQALSARMSTDWRWILKPKYPGTHQVHLSVIAHVQVDGEVVERNIKTFDRVLTVQITPIQWLLSVLREHWQWVVGTIVAPIGIWWLTTRRKRSRR